MNGTLTPASWRPTGALVRAALVGPVLGLAGVLAGRPALVVLAAPFAVFFLVAALRRPVDSPQVTTAVQHRAVAEGDATVLLTEVTGEGIEQMTQLVTPAAYTALQPSSGATSTSKPAPSGTLAVHFGVSQRRWGARSVGDGLVAVTSRWGGYMWGPAPVVGSRVITLPSPLPFDSHAETPRPTGLVGANRGNRDGEGTEFSGIREFKAGDRLRRIHWRSSLRTGRLHTITTTAEQDSEVLLLVDALAVLGESGGIDGASSSLDTAVRAAAALSDHHLRIGNRVGLRVMGGTRQVLRPAAGSRHQRRVQEILARVAAGPWEQAPQRLRLGVGAGTTVVALSPLLSPLLITALVDLANRGLPVVAIDTLPARPGAGRRPDAEEEVAWRLRLVERELELVALARTGIPVVAWRGPGTLDEVLHRLARRGQVPRAVVR